MPSAQFKLDKEKKEVLEECIRNL